MLSTQEGRDYQYYKIYIWGGLAAIFVYIIVAVVIFIVNVVKVLNEYERGVIFRLGRLIPVKGPGIVIVWPIGVDLHPDILWIDTPIKSEIIKKWKQAIGRVKSHGFRYRTKGGAL